MQRHTPSLAPVVRHEFESMIDKYLRKEIELDDHAAHLLFSANRWELMPQMKRDLEAGTTLVVDRYAFSGVAFTSAKVPFFPLCCVHVCACPVQCLHTHVHIHTISWPLPHLLGFAEKGLDIEWCKQPDAQLPSPDLHIHLDLDPDLAAQRGGFGSERYEVTEFQATVKAKVRACMVALLKLSCSL